MKLLRSKYLYLFIGILSLTLSFQNCARESFKSLDGSSSEASTTSASSVESNSNATGSDKQNTSQSNQSSGSSGGASQFPNSQVRQPASPSSPSTPNVGSPIQMPAAPTPVSQQPTAPSAPASQQPSTPSSLQPLAPVPPYLGNFVAGDKSTCDNSVANLIRSKLSSGVMSVVAPRCQLGGGCGLSCGKPNGTSCVSANPNAYGACVDQSDIDTYIIYNMQVYNSRSGFNFVAANQTDCNNSIQDSHRYYAGSNTKSSTSCKIGGGCGVSCGKPNGTSCVSANPNVMGACYGYDEFRDL